MIVFLMRAADSNRSDKQLCYQVCYHKRFLGAVLVRVRVVHYYRNSVLYLSIFNCQEKAVST